MPLPLLSLLGRLTAGTMLLSAGAPALQSAKNALDARPHRLSQGEMDALLSAAYAKAGVAKRAMRGVPKMRVTPAVPASARRRVVLGAVELLPGRSLLDEEAHLRLSVPKATERAWRAELAAGKASLGRKGRLLVQIGEMEFARREPTRAKPLFDRAAAILPLSSHDRGLARFDAALARYAEGRFREARLAFRSALAAPLVGVDRRLAAVYARHAAACEGYHLAHERLGIPEPPFLDPLCGVASLGVCLRGRGMPYAKASLLAKVYHDGEGSDLTDLANALPRLGLVGRVVAADEMGLRALPKPVVAHVEHDHFVAVVAADRDGVEYVCSDCGAWPGGPVRLSWKQWRAMESRQILAVAKPGTAEALALASLPTDHAQGVGHVRLAAHAPQTSGVVTAAERILSAMGTTVLAQGWLLRLGSATCGVMNTAAHAPCGVVAMPFHRCGNGSEHGTSDPVNLATGEEEYAASQALHVYNPTGPSVNWRPSYGSLATPPVTGFGAGWSHPYNYRIEDAATPATWAGTTPPTTHPVALVLPNSGRVAFTVNPSAPPTSSAPVQHAVVEVGIPILVDWLYDASDPSGRYRVTMKDRSAWTFAHLTASGATGGAGSGGPTGTVTPGTFFYPVKVQDRVGNSITLNWGAFLYGTFDAAAFSDAGLGLTSIDDSSGSPLLTVGYDANARIVSASDRYGRSVYYTVASFSSTSVPSGSPQREDELTAVSQIVTTGTTSPPVRFAYGYANYGIDHYGETLPFLHTISVPSATGTGMATATLDYDATDGSIVDTVDANGNQTLYRAVTVGGVVQPNATRVQVKNPSGTLVYQVDEYFNGQMSGTQTVNASGQTVVSRLYADPSTPYAASSVTDGNGRTWHTTHDAYGNPLTTTTPKGTVTTYAWSYTNFSLGELSSVQQGSKTPTTYSYYTPSGLVASVDTPVPGNVGASATQSQTYTFNARGNVTQIVSSGNNATTSRVVSFIYGSSNPLGHPAGMMDERGKITWLGYDARGNLTYQQDPNGNSTNWDYNLADQVIATFLPYTGTNGPYQTTICANHPFYPGGPMDQSFVADESGSLSHFTYCTYGAEGEDLARSGSTPSAGIVYDAAYRTKSITDGNGHTTSYTYDLSGRMTQIALPGASGTGYDEIQLTSYDPVGNLLSRTDGNGQVTNYAYGDADGRLTAISFPGNTSYNVTYVYDGYDRLTSTADGTGGSSKSYDDRNKPISETRTYTGLPAQSFAYTYWPDGSRHTMTNVAGTWTYGYDEDGRYTSLVSPAGTASASYYDNGREATRTLPNGVTTSYTYNPILRFTSVTSQTGSGSTLSAYGSFAYNGVFNLTGFVANVPGATSQSGSVAYSYDTLNRTTGESSSRLGSYSNAFGYDASGNPTTFRGATQSFNADDQRTGTGYAYDGDGNPTTYGGTSLGFDPGNRVASIGAAWTASYRADGLRAWKSVSGVKTYYLYDKGEPILELDASGAVKAVNVFAPDGLVARQQAGAWTSYTFDPQGNVAQRLNASGSVVSSSVYDAYGAESTTGTPPADPFGYNARWGYLLDRENGLYLCEHRYYDPGAGRWINRDPIGTRGGLDLYAYGDSNAQAIDRSGLLGSTCDTPPEDAAECLADLCEANGGENCDPIPPPPFPIPEPPTGPIGSGPTCPVGDGPVAGPDPSNPIDPTNPYPTPPFRDWPWPEPSVPQPAPPGLDELPVTIEYDPEYCRMRLLGLYFDYVAEGDMNGVSYGDFMNCMREACKEGGYSEKNPISEEDGQNMVKKCLGLQ